MLGPAGRPRRRRHHRLRGLRLRPRPRAHRGVLLGVLRRLRRAGEGPGLRRPQGDEARRARPTAALHLALSTLQRLLAPFLPFVTEEVWSWWQEGSVHTGRLARRRGGGGRRRRRPAALPSAVEVLAAVRKAKTAAKRNLKGRWPGSWWPTRARARRSALGRGRRPRRRCHRAEADLGRGRPGLGQRRPRSRVTLRSAQHALRRCASSIRGESNRCAPPAWRLRRPGGTGSGPGRSRGPSAGRRQEVRAVADLGAHGLLEGHGHAGLVERDLAAGPAAPA